MTLYPSSDLPDFINEVIRWRRDYEEMCRKVAGLEKKYSLTSGKRGPAFPEGPVADNPEPDDRTKPPITEAETYRLQDRIEREVNTLADMGIYTTTRWKLTAHCRFHGEQVLFWETNAAVPEIRWMECFGCFNNGITKRLDIDERKKLEEEQT